ncbi:MAG TPA: FAD-binding and (Fe-S)-binding domain-containing protein [Vicinamibacterales bacterium]|nr:FAD-binding and (Fe-S)-binding domain-containing protein [Vicinamibacterales bacterium]
MLEQALRRAVRGDVRFDAGSQALYATDASNYRQVPIGVVFPRDADDVAAAVAVCRQHGAPVLPRGAGTSLAGQGCNEAVVFDFSRYMTRIVEIDPARRLARVEPGVILDVLRAAAERHHLTFGPDPATHSRCTLGGMIGNNSCGVHSIMAGKTGDNIDSLDVLTYDGIRLRVGQTTDADLRERIAAGGRAGEIYAGLRALRDRVGHLVRERYPDIPRRVSGFNLDELLPEKGFHVARALAGSEGTCATVLEATLRLVPSPPNRVLLVIGYRDVFAAADDVPDVVGSGVIGLEGFDEVLVDHMRRKRLNPRELDLLPPGGGWLLAEFGAETSAEAEARAQALYARLAAHPAAPTGRLFLSQDSQREIWRVREAALGATAYVPGEPKSWEGWEDAAVRPDRLGRYLREFRALLARYDYRGALYGHFGHGCVHTRTNFDLRSREGIQKYRAFVNDAADLVLRHGGSLSGEHGDGQSRGELLPKMFGPELVDAFIEFKRLWDPDWKMNPGKLVRPYRLDEHLRLGAEYRTPPLQTHFQFPQDEGHFAEATLRCVGVGECRRLHGGTMCPSYMVTLEEQHSTRGRAHLLFEMARGDVIKGGWQDEHVKEALDLCLACKGCKGDCPVSVDVATYKAEFLSHYYERRRRPRHAYAFGLIFRWAPLAALAPGLVNFATQTPGLRGVAKAIAGIAPGRQIPRFASEPFTTWFRKHRRTPPDGAPHVILWPDTFNNYLLPGTARAAVEVLEAAGFTVDVPRQRVCCGRPLYDYGMLDTAKAVLRDAMRKLRAERPDVPIVVLEPSCAAVFRDELLNLFPDDAEAQALSRRVVLLSEFLVRHAPSFRPRLEAHALVHAHCHHKAVMRIDDEKAVIDAMGVRARVLDSGCCGMAGAFGFESEHYDMSTRVGERVLLPAVREADPATLIIADGFSCREQIRQGTGRRALHLAEVVAKALAERLG